MQSMGALQQSIDIGKRLLVWTRAVEIQELTARGIHPDSAEARRYKGRATPPRFRIPPRLGRQLGGGPQRLPGGYSGAARLWGTLRALMTRLKAAVQ